MSFENSASLQEFDAELTCRFCLVKGGDNMQDIFDEDLTLNFESGYSSIINVIKYAIDVMITFSENKSSFICNECFKLLENACTFKKLCLASELSNLNNDEDDIAELKDSQKIIDGDAIGENVEMLESDESLFLIASKNKIEDETSKIESEHKIQSEDIEMKCSSCKYKTNNCKSMVKHRSKLKHFKNVCHICQCSLSTFGSLRLHLQSHFPPKYFCKKCSYATTNRNDLTVHERTHTGEKPYKCSRCFRSFNHPSNFKKHITRRHTP